MLELWGRPNAYNVQKALWILRELDLEFIHHDLGSRPGDLDSEEFLAINPHARIPVLRDGEDVIWESNTILRYLAARYSPDDLWPSDPLQRSKAERWMDWELGRLQPDFIDLFWSYYRTPAAARDQKRIDAARERCRADMQQLADHLGQREYLGGDRFSMGDIPCAVCLYRYFEMGLECERPQALMRWYQSLCERPAYRQTIMLPFDELEGRQDY